MSSSWYRSYTSQMIMVCAQPGVTHGLYCHCCRRPFDDHDAPFLCCLVSKTPGGLEVCNSTSDGRRQAGLGCFDDNYLLICTENRGLESG